MTQEDRAGDPSEGSRRTGLRGRAKQWWRRQSPVVQGAVLSVFGMLAVAAVTWLVPYLWHLAQRIAGKEQHGLAVDYDVPDASGWVFAGKVYADLTPPLAQVQDDELDSWAKENGGTPDYQVLRLIVRGKSDKTVFVKRLEPKVECGPSSVGVHVAEGVPQSLVPERSADLQADAKPLKIAFTDDRGDLIKPPVYKVTETDPEHITLDVYTATHRCKWSVIVHWSVNGDDHETRIPEKGQYVVTGSNAATEYRGTDGELLP
ncbi:hypothetical protein ABZT48_33810 [Streptomyces avermitilis]|uniref:hypothetical protein n=1 Tax=Streptomyces avermitilis TaxID=33903 RepID=UPI0033B786DC